MHDSPSVRTCLWFEKEGLKAAEFYVSILPGSKIDAVHAHGNPDEPLVVEFTLQGSPMMILTAGPYYKLTPAASISVTTRDQQETDRLWSSLLSDGGVESRCGWLTDRWGVSWQIIPDALPRLLGAPDRAAAERARAAMMTMNRVDISALEAAFHSTPAPENAMNQTVTIDTFVNATPAEAWTAFTTAEAITQWNQATPEWHCPSADVDLRVGGTYLARMEARDGSFGFDFEAVYEEVDVDRGVTLLMGDGRRARTTFVAEGDGTRVTTTFDAEPTNPVDMQRDGWQAILNSYAAWVGQAHTKS